jgi:plasmid replication initiation protein
VIITVRSKKLVVKSNYIVEASYKLSLGEQRVIYVLTSMIQFNDEDFKPYKFTVKEFTEILGTKSKDMYKQVAEYVEGLRDRDLTIIKEKSILKTKWLSSAEYFTDDGYVELEFSPKLKPYLLLLKERFTQLNLSQMVSFTSQYSGRIYELLKQYGQIGERTFKVEDLKRILGIQSNEYKLYGDFKRKILNKSKQEINDNSDLYIDFEEIKEVRKVVTIKFIIKNKPGKAVDEIAITKVKAATTRKTSTNLKQVQSIFHSHRITDVEAKAILKDAKNNLGLIKKCYEYCLTKDIKNLVGYMRRLVNEFIEPQTNKKTSGDFNNFEQRTYDFVDLEKRLLGWEVEEDISEEA